MVFTQDAVNSDELQRPEYIMSNVCVCVCGSGTAILVGTFKKKVLVGTFCRSPLS